MEAKDLLKKCGYKRRYNDSNCIIYDLKIKQPYCDLPDTFLIRKGNYEVEFSTDYIEEHTHLGTFCVNLSQELLQAINQEIEKLKSIRRKL